MGIECPRALSLCAVEALEWLLGVFLGADRATKRSSQPESGHLAAVLAVRKPSRRNRPHPTRQAIRLRAVGTPVVGHDVSGTDSQTLVRAMQPSTIMIPVWQCGHSRNDRPVRASKRSR